MRSTETLLYMHAATVFWLVTPCHLIPMYQPFSGLCCLRFQVPSKKTYFYRIIIFPDNRQVAYHTNFVRPPIRTNARWPSGGKWQTIDTSYSNSQRLPWSWYRRIPRKRCNVSSKLMASHVTSRNPNILRSLRTSNLTSAFVFIALIYNGGNQHLKDSVFNSTWTITAKRRASFAIGLLHPLHDARPLLAYSALYGKSSDMIHHYWHSVTKQYDVHYAIHRHKPSYTNTYPQISTHLIRANLVTHSHRWSSRSETQC
jgi:hypothetical protein